MARLCSQLCQHPHPLLSSRQHKLNENLVSRPNSLYTYVSAITSKIAAILSALEISSVPQLHLGHQYIIQQSLYTSNNEIQAQQPSVAVTRTTKTCLFSRISTCNKKFNTQTPQSPNIVSVILIAAVDLRADPQRAGFFIKSSHVRLGGFN